MNILIVSSLDNKIFGNFLSGYISYVNTKNGNDRNILVINNILDNPLGNTQEDNSNIKIVELFGGCACCMTSIELCEELNKYDKCCDVLVFVTASANVLNLKKTLLKYVKSITSIVTLIICHEELDITHNYDIVNKEITKDLFLKVENNMVLKNRFYGEKKKRNE